MARAWILPPSGPLLVQTFAPAETWPLGPTVSRTRKAMNRTYRRKAAQRIVTLLLHPGLFRLVEHLVGPPLVDAQSLILGAGPVVETLCSYRPLSSSQLISLLHRIALPASREPQCLVYHNSERLSVVKVRFQRTSRISHRFQPLASLWGFSAAHQNPKNLFTGHKMAPCELSTEPPKVSDSKKPSSLGNPPTVSPSCAS
jgi:hypothetical protein